MEGKTQLVIVFLVFMLVIISPFAAAIEIDINKIDQKQINQGDSERSLVFLNSDFPLGNTSNCYVEIEKNDDPEEITVNVYEKVIFKEDGRLDINLIMHILSPKLVNLFKSSFGIPEDLERIRSDIPHEVKRKILLKNENGINEEEIVEPVKEKFLEGISKEQKFLYGFNIIEFKSSKLYSEDLNKEILINIEAEALPHITELYKCEYSSILTIESAPKDILNKFMSHQLEISQLMINYIPGNQIFVKNVEIDINLPKSARIVYVKKDKRFFELGSSYISLDLVTQEQDNKIKLSEKLVVMENYQSARENEINELFKIKYEIKNNCEHCHIIKTDYNDYNLSTLDDYSWTWSKDFDVIHLSGAEGGISYSVDVDLYLIMDGTLHLDLEKKEKEIWAGFLFRSGVKVNVTISGAFEHTWTFNIGHLSGKQYSWCGMVPLVITVNVDLVAKLYVSVKGEVHIYINPEANFNLKAGAALRFQWAWPPVHFSPIFDSSVGGSFEKEFDLSTEAKIRPSLGVGIGILVYEIIGPRIEPEVYLEGAIGYSISNGVYWKAELGFDLNVGVQFTRFIHFNWPTPLYHKPLASWKSDNTPADTIPPVTTLYMGPQRKDYIGPCEYLWFDSIDPGIEASGVHETKFNIPENSSNWYTIHKSLICNVITNLQQYNVKYYSVDKAGNKESIKTESCKVDLYAPQTGLGFKGEYKQIDRKTFEIVKGSTHVLLLGSDTADIFGNSGVRVWFTAQHESGYEIEWNITNYYDGNNWYGWDLTFNEIGRWNVTWVAEDGVWNVKADSIVIYVKNEVKPYSISIDSPKRGDIVIFGRKVINYPTMSLALYIGGPVKCVAFDNGSGVAKVLFECGGVKITNETPSNGYFSAVMSNIPEGIHTLFVKAYDCIGKEVANDSVEILKIGRA